MVSIISPFNSFNWPLQTPDRFGKMKVNYHELNQVVAIMTAAGTDGGSLLEKNVALIYGMQLWLWQMYSFLSLSRSTQSSLQSPRNSQQ